jgi:hypothetical protein
MFNRGVNIMVSLESRMAELASTTINLYTSKENFSQLMNTSFGRPKNQRLNQATDAILQQIKQTFDQDSLVQKLEQEHPQQWHSVAHKHYTTQVLGRVQKAYELYQKNQPNTCPCTLV